MADEFIPCALLDRHSPSAYGDDASHAFAQPGVVSARELPGRHDRVSIEHEGAVYELRQTRNDKFIPTR